MPPPLIITERIFYMDIIIKEKDLKEGFKVGDFVLVDSKKYAKWQEGLNKKSSGGKNTWKNVSPEERSRRMKELSLKAQAARKLKREQKALKD